MATSQVNPDTAPRPETDHVQAPATPTVPPPAESRLALTDNRPVEIQKFEFQQRCAKLFSASGLFADIKGQSVEQSIAQAFVKIALGDSMGFNPAESMTGIDIIQGRVAVGSSIRAARMQRAGYSWDILQLDDKGCRLRLYYKGQPLTQEEIDAKSGDVRKVPAIVSFTADDAKSAGLIAKDNYRKNPRNMFFARAITNAQRWYAPGILGVDILDTEEAVTLDVPSLAQSTQDQNLAGKTGSVVSGIKERYAQNKPAEAVDPPSAPAEEPQVSAQPQAEPYQAGVFPQEPRGRGRTKTGDVERS